MNGVQTRFKCKLDVKRCKRFVFPPSSLLPRSNALKTKAIRYFQTDRTLTRIVSPPLDAKGAAAALDKIGKYTRSDKEDEKFDYSQLVPPSFEPSDDVTLLEGLEPIEDLEGTRSEMRSRFKGMLSKKAVDIRPIEEEEEE